MGRELRDDAWYARQAARRGPACWPGCKCAKCWFAPVTCVVCHAEFLRPPMLQHHRVKVHAAPKQSKAHTGLLIPDGAGFLKWAIATKGKYSLTALSRFATTLAQVKFKPGSRRSRFPATLLDVLSAMEKPNNELWEVSGSVPAVLGAAIYNLAKAADIHPRFVVPGILAYGLEHLAMELKNTGAAPRVRDMPAPILKPEEKPSGKSKTFTPFGPQL